MTEDRDILATVHRVAAHALSGQAGRNEGMLKLADSMGRIRERWDQLESIHAASQARIAELEDLLDVTRRTAAAKEAAAIEEIDLGKAEIVRLTDAHAQEIARLTEAHGEEITRLGSVHQNALDDAAAKANQEIEDVQSVAKQSIDTLVETTRKAHTALASENAGLRGRLEEVMVENEKLVRGIGILITQTQNTTRAMLEEDNILTTAIFELMDSMGIRDEARGSESAPIVYLEAPARED